MTRRERRILLGGAIVLAVICSGLFARAVLAQRAADYAHAQARAALLVSSTAPASDLADRIMLRWSGATGQVRYWLALQRFRLVAASATAMAETTLSAPLALIFSLEQTETYLRRAAVSAGTRAVRSRLYDMLGLAYYDDAALHAGTGPIESELDARAVEAFQQAVLADGTNEAAKTNLELVLRKQLKRKEAQAEHTNPPPDTQRAEGGNQDSGGLPDQNGTAGKRVRGGY